MKTFWIEILISPNQETTTTTHHSIFFFPFTRMQNNQSYYNRNHTTKFDFRYEQPNQITIKKNSFFRSNWKITYLTHLPIIRWQLLKVDCVLHQYRFQISSSSPRYWLFFHFCMRPFYSDVCVHTKLLTDDYGTTIFSLFSLYTIWSWDLTTKQRTQISSYSLSFGECRVFLIVNLVNQSCWHSYWMMRMMIWHWY